VNYTEVYLVRERLENGTWITVWEGDAATEAGALLVMNEASVGRAGSWRVVRRMDVTVGTISKARP